MPFGLAGVLHSAFGALNHAYEKKGVRRGSLGDKRTCFASVPVTAENSRCGGGRSTVFGPDKYVTQAMSSAI